MPFKREESVPWGIVADLEKVYLHHFQLLAQAIRMYREASFLYKIGRRMEASNTFKTADAFLEEHRLIVGPWQEGWDVVARGETKEGEQQ